MTWKKIMKLIPLVLFLGILFSWVVVKAQAATTKAIDTSYVGQVRWDVNKVFTEELLIQATHLSEVSAIKEVKLADHPEFSGIIPGIYPFKVTLETKLNQTIEKNFLLYAFQEPSEPAGIVEESNQPSVIAKADETAQKTPPATKATNEKETPAATPAITTEASEPPKSVASGEVSSNEETKQTQSAQSEAPKKNETTETQTTPRQTAPAKKQVPNTQAPTQSSVLKFNGQTIPFVQMNGAPDAPRKNAGTWIGTGAVNDGLPTHFMGHNPGDFSGVMELGVGSAITVVDAGGQQNTYYVQEVLDVTDDGYNYHNLQDDVFPRLLDAGGERISLQTCVTDFVNRIVLAY